MWLAARGILRGFLRLWTYGANMSFDEILDHSADVFSFYISSMIGVSNVWLEVRVRLVMTEKSGIMKIMVGSRLCPVL